MIVSAQDAPAVAPELPPPDRPALLALPAAASPTPTPLQAFVVHSQLPDGKTLSTIVRRWRTRDIDGGCGLCAGRCRAAHGGDWDAPGGPQSVCVLTGIGHVDPSAAAAFSPDRGH